MTRFHFFTATGMRHLFAMTIPVVLFAISPSVGAADPAAAMAGAASAPVGHGEERKLIAADRSAAEARFVERERVCQKRFVVTSCVDEAKAERRRTVDHLRERQLVVDEAARQQRGEERKAELAEKAAEDARRDAARASNSATPASSAPLQPGMGLPFESSRTSQRQAVGLAPRSNSPRPKVTHAPKPKSRESAADRQSRETASRNAFEASKAEAEAHRQQVLERTARRTAQKPPARPLPPAPVQAASGMTGAASSP